MWREIGIPDTLLDTLKAWNDLGNQVLGCLEKEPTAAEYDRFWARGRELAAEVQQRVGPEFEVVCAVDLPKA